MFNVQLNKPGLIAPLNKVLLCFVVNEPICHSKKRTEIPPEVVIIRCCNDSVAFDLLRSRRAIWLKSS